MNIPKPWRETPLIESAALSKAAGCRILLKLDNLQPSGSFKSRGVGNYMCARLREHSITTYTSTAPPIHFYSSSGGNAGLAAVHASQLLQKPCTVIVPTSTTRLMIDKIRAAGAHDVIQIGASWKEADAYLREEVLAADPGGVYVPPFDHEDIWEGNSTVVEECMKDFSEKYGRAGGPKQVNCGSPSSNTTENDSGYNTPSNLSFGQLADGHDVPPPAAIVCSVGGGGLFNGISQALRTSKTQSDLDWSTVPIVAVETQGADSLSQSLAAGAHITLDAITSAATSLGARRISNRTWDLAQKGTTDGTVKSVVLSDKEAAKGCVALAEEEKLLVELACGVNVAMCFGGRLEKALGRKLSREEFVILVVCGGSNVTTGKVEEWMKE